MAVTRKCARCGREFPAEGNRKYCSKMCALTVNLERNRRKAAEKREAGR